MFKTLYQSLWHQQCKSVYSKRTATSVSACIVGAGPAGYYTAQRLLKSDEPLTVDIVDKLPVPFGLVRFGVAPDHPEVKNVINTFTQTATKYGDRCRFIGNVEVGEDITIAKLAQCYDVVVLSYGAENDRRLGIPGENAQGVYSAREIVGWYNGLPEFAALAPDLSKESCVILGQGNVALDIARLLLMPIDELSKTDICRHALRSIAQSKIKDVYIVGRRGPLQAAFTIKEFREMTKLPKTNPDVLQEDVRDISVADLPRPRTRLTDLIISSSKAKHVHDRSWRLRFLHTPQEIVTDNNQVTAVKFTKNKLVGDSIESQQAVLTDETMDILCGTVIRSIGYQSLSLAIDDQVVPFDKKRSIIPNHKGKVEGRPGLYCSGWVKRGPVGVIATTMNDAFETADTIIADIKSGQITTNNEMERNVWQEHIGKKMVSFSEWEKIDEEEILRGGNTKPREKIVDIEEMLRIAKR